MPPTSARDRRRGAELAGQRGGASAPATGPEKIASKGARRPRANDIVPPPERMIESAPPKPLRGQPLLERPQVAGQRGRDVGVEHGGARALELAVLARELVRERDLAGEACARSSAAAPARGPGSPRRSGTRPRRRRRPPARALARGRDVRLVERPCTAPSASMPPRAEPQPARHERRRRRPAAGRTRRRGCRGGSRARRGTLRCTAARPSRRGAAAARSGPTVVPWTKRRDRAQRAPASTRRAPPARRSPGLGSVGPCRP